MRLHEEEDDEGEEEDEEEEEEAKAKDEQCPPHKSNRYLDDNHSNAVLCPQFNQSATNRRPELDHT